MIESLLQTNFKVSTTPEDVLVINAVLDVTGTFWQTDDGQNVVNDSGSVDLGNS